MAGRYPEKATVTTISGAEHPSDKQCLQESEQYKPSGLKKSESKIWDRVCPELVREGRMKPLFVDALHQYCIVLAAMNKKHRWLSKHGYNYKVTGRNGVQVKTHPYFAQRNELFRQWNSLVAQFGLSAGTERRFVSGQMGLFDDPSNPFNQL